MLPTVSVLHRSLGLWGSIPRKGEEGGCSPIHSPWSLGFKPTAGVELSDLGESLTEVVYFKPHVTPGGGSGEQGPQEELRGEQA